MSYLRPDLLRARNSAASKSEICEKSTLQLAQTDGQEKLTRIIVDLAAPVLLIRVLLLRVQQCDTSHTNDNTRTTLTTLTTLTTTSKLS